MKYFTALFVLGICGVTSPAAVTLIDVVSFAPAQPTNHVVNDIEIDFTGQYTGSQLLLTLTSGAIYQDPSFDSATAPLPGLVSAFPVVAFDSFFAQGSLTDSGPFGNPNVGGGAVNLGGNSTASISASTINQAWNPAGGQVIVNQANFVTARITLSNDATGTFSYLASDGQVSIVGGAISNGVMTAVPEPGAAQFMSTALLVGIVVQARRSLVRRRS